MARDRLLFKYVGDGTEFHEGIPMRDIRESDRPDLTDEHLVTLAASRVYRARNDADEEAEAAAERLARATPAPEVGDVPPAPTPDVAPAPMPRTRRGD